MIRKQDYNWFTDAEGNECLGKGSMPLFEIVKEKPTLYRIMYYGTCGIATFRTQEEAKDYIKKKMGDLI